VCSDIRRDLLTQSRRAWRDVQKFLGAVSEKERERNKKRRRKINKHSFRRPLLFFLSLFQKGKKIFCTLPSLPHAKRREKKNSLALRVLSQSQHTACKRGKHTSKINEKEIGFAFTRRTPKL
jgi:hypothetical protein